MSASSNVKWGHSQSTRYFRVKWNIYRYPKCSPKGRGLAEIKHQRLFPHLPWLGAWLPREGDRLLVRFGVPQGIPYSLGGEFIQEKSLDPSFLIHCSVSHLEDSSQTNLQLTSVTCSRAPLARTRWVSVRKDGKHSRMACSSLNSRSSPITRDEASDTTNSEFPPFVTTNLLEFLLK